MITWFCSSQRLQRAIFWSFETGKRVSTPPVWCLMFDDPPESNAKCWDPPNAKCHWNLSVCFWAKSSLNSGAVWEKMKTDCIVHIHSHPFTSIHIYSHPFTSIHIHPCPFTLLSCVFFHHLPPSSTLPLPFRHGMAASTDAQRSAMRRCHASCNELQWVAMYVQFAARLDLLGVR